MIFYVVILKKRLKTTTLEAIKRTDNSRFALRNKRYIWTIGSINCSTKVISNIQTIIKATCLMLFLHAVDFQRGYDLPFHKKNFFIKIMVVSKLKKKTKKIARNQEKE